MTTITAKSKITLLILIRAENFAFVRSKSSLGPVLDALDAYTESGEPKDLRELNKQIKLISLDKRQEYPATVRYLRQMVSGESLQLNWTKVAANGFRIISDLKEYKDSFGPTFEKKLNSLPVGSRWLDAGAGRAKAQIEYLEGGGNGECHAVAYQKPDDPEIEKAIKKFSSRFRYVDGKYFGEMSDTDLRLGRGKFDLITDLNGVLYYTHTLVEDVRRYLQILKVGGLLAVTGSDIRIEGSGVAHEAKDSSDLALWLKNCDFVDFERYKTGACLLTKRDERASPKPLVFDAFEPTFGNSPVRCYTTSLTLRF